MENVFTADEEKKWEQLINKNERLIATTKRLYVVSNDDSRIAVVFRKAVVGCEYSLKNYMVAGYLLVSIALLLMVMLIVSGSMKAAFFCLLILGGLGFAAMCKEERLDISIAGGDELKLVRRKFFAFNFSPELVHLVKDISSLEDL